MGLKLIDLTGQQFGDWTVIEKAKGYKYTAWKCRCSCGTEKDVVAQSLRRGATKSCGYHRAQYVDRDANKQIFLDNAQQKHGARYDYSKIEYVNSTTKVWIHCNECGTDFLQAPINHLNGFGCPECSSRLLYQRPIHDLSGKRFGMLFAEDYAGDGRWKCTCDCGNTVEVKTTHLMVGASSSCGCKKTGTLEDFIARAVAIYGSKYDYSSVEFTTLGTPVTIICPKHGSFQKTPTNFLLGKACPVCAYHSISEKQRSTKEEFVEKAVAIHDDKYDYSDVEYINAGTRVKIKCNCCGNSFLQAPNAHLAGKGCSACASYGFQPSLPGVLYVLSCGDITKVGITNRDAEDRAAKISKSFGAEFSVLRTYHFSVGQHCSDVETGLLRWLRKKYRSPGFVFDGYTESFYSVDCSDLYPKIEEFIQEVTSV